ncbi:SUF system Fe-S cluster assembly regulator [Psychromonas sp.]|uniref:SUF system Fe-S cluster assembly regulator n=1 Tax=Psychromonas sp. TaxID=1884585 RepID=UPI00356879D6
MLRVNKLTDYGSVILAFMASRPDQVMSAASLSRDLLLPLATVRKLLKMLVNSGLLCSSLGKQGGYQLARSADKISLAEIINVLEGGIELTDCAMKEGLCRIEGSCEIRQNWQGLNQIVQRSLSQVSLQEMLVPRERAQKIISGS